MEDRGLRRALTIFKYSDSEPNEVFTAILHTFILPMALWSEMFTSPMLIVGSILCGLFQGWAVLWDGSLKMRGHAVKVACLIAIATVLNYYMEGMLHGSNVGWLLVMLFAIWNIIRIENQKTIEHLRNKYNDQTHVFIKED
jgi:xanthine/uracil permease